MLSLLNTSSESVFTSTLFAVLVLFPDDWPVRSSFVSPLNKHFLRADFDSVKEILPGEPRGEQTRFDSVSLNGLAPRSARQEFTVCAFLMFLHLWAGNGVETFRVMY